MTHKEKQQAEAITRLREWIKPGDTIHTILRHVSKSGMFRIIELVKIDSDGSVKAIGWNAADAMGDKYDRERDGIRVSGCGMDMGFHLVYNLARTLFPDFRCIGKDCPSNDHSNERTRNYCKGRKHSDGGYALKHRWL